MAWFVYVLESESTGRYYTGSTDDLTKRLDYHNRGLSPWTRGRGPWRLAYIEPYPTRGAAMQRERQLKRWRSHQSIQALIASAETDNDRGVAQPG